MHVQYAILIEEEKIFLFQILMNVVMTQTHALSSVLTLKEVIPVVVMAAIGLMLMGSPAMVHTVMLSLPCILVYIRIIHVSVGVPYI